MISDFSGREGIDPSLIPLLGNDNGEQDVALLSTCKSFMHTIMEWSDTHEFSVGIGRMGLLGSTVANNINLAQGTRYPRIQQQDYSTTIAFTTLLFPCPKESYCSGTSDILKSTMFFLLILYT